MSAHKIKEVLNRSNLDGAYRSSPSPPVQFLRPLQDFEQRLLPNEQHFLNTVDRRRAAHLLRVILTARQVSEDNPIRHEDVHSTFLGLGFEGEDVIDIMNHANKIPSEYTQGFIILRRLDFQGRAHFYLSELLLTQGRKTPILRKMSAHETSGVLNRPNLCSTYMSGRSSWALLPYRNDFEQRLLPDEPHFLNTTDRRRAAHFFSVILVARQASDKCPISHKDILPTLIQHGFGGEDLIDIMNHANKIPSEYTQGFIIRRRVDCLNMAYFHVNEIVRVD